MAAGGKPGNGNRSAAAESQQLNCPQQVELWIGVAARRDPVIEHRGVKAETVEFFGDIVALALNADHFVAAAGNNQNRSSVGAVFRRKRIQVNERFKVAVGGAVALPELESAVHQSR